MRILPVLLGCLLPVLALWAEPPANLEAQQELHNESMRYAQQLLSASTQISLAYYRPVERETLLEAALTGLYQAARLPVPRNLANDLQRLTDEGALIDYLIRQRTAVGLGEGTQDSKAILASCQAMLRKLDPYSGIMTEADRRDQPWGDQPIGLGLDLQDNIGIGPLRIRKVLPGSPAQKAGLKPGDIITHIDAEPVREGITSSEAAGKLRRPHAIASTEIAPPDDLSASAGPRSGRPVRLRVFAPGQPARDVILVPETGRPEAVLGVRRQANNHWDYWLDREQRIAHVRVQALHRGTADELRDVLVRLEDDVRAVILDLRWSPGGFLEEAYTLAGLFLEDELLATVRSRSERETKYYNTQPRRFPKIPMIVLVNGSTSGGAELVAAALQDHRRARIVGQRTRGKGTVQSTLYIGIPGSTIKLTSGEFLRPSGKTLHRQPNSRARDDWGVRPEVELECRVSPEFDQQLREAWEQQTLRPGHVLQLLPLDDLTADPALQIARKALTATLERQSARR